METDFKCCVKQNFSLFHPSVKLTIYVLKLTVHKAQLIYEKRLNCTF